jgi:hypothetical protein
MKITEYSFSFDHDFLIEDYYLSYNEWGNNY